MGYDDYWGPAMKPGEKALLVSRPSMTCSDWLLEDSLGFRVDRFSI